MKLKPSAILFDMDGVLVNSFDAWWKSLNITMKSFKYKEVSREEFSRIYWGHGLRDNVKRMGFSEEVGKHCNTVYRATCRLLTSIRLLFQFGDGLNFLAKVPARAYG